ncbi:MAG: DUF2007 domain-containing protein [Planctomycetaceae bacterium]
MSDHDPDELVTVYTVVEPTRAELLRAVLQSEGIRCNIGGETQAGLTGTTSIDILVRAIDADRAHRLIVSHEEGHT